jgi:TRAP-type mannitol/chloroaromatic compound transport system substrate-binding protein
MTIPDDFKWTLQDITKLTTVESKKEFLKENEKNLKILRSGYHLKSDNYSEQILTERLSVIVERVKQEVINSNDKFAAVIQCVDEPWDVVLVELWLREIHRSARGNIDELQANGKLF